MSMDLTKSEIDAALGLLKMNSLRKKRTSFGMKVKKTLLQQTVLKNVYQITNFPSTETRNELALLLGISQRSVQVWFQNKRQISKRKEVSKSNKEKSFSNEYNRFCQVEFNSDYNEEFVCDIPSTQLVDIIRSCDARMDEKEEREKN